MAKGLIVYFDGPDGVGKTTQLELAAKMLESAGHRVHAIHTIGGTPIGDLLRDVLFSDNERPPETSLHIALASQYALAEDIIRRRSDGEVILIDRSPLSIVAYQVYGDGLDNETGFEAAKQILDLVKPDLTLVYMAPVDELKKRRQAQVAAGKKRDHFEKMDNDYHLRTTKGYEAAVQSFKTTVIDATGSVDDIHTATMDAIGSVI
jgi:dTMP kinase